MAEGGPKAPPRIVDAQAIPVIGIDDHLPAVPPERLNADALRRRFATPAAFVPEFTGDAARFFPNRPLRPAAVLIGLVQHPEGLRVLLTRRTDHLRDHAGQVSFPGGRSEPHDADAAATALREAHEEVGLPRRNAEVIGTLPAYGTVTSFLVTPVVALVDPFEPQLDAGEVAEAFEVPLDFLMTPAHHRRHRYEWEGGTRQFLSMPWEGRFIWGATAAMIRNLYRFLSA